NGTGIASTFSVTVYDLSGHQVWTDEQANVDHITWDGSGLANGGYIYVVMATDGENTFTGKGTVFINK
ncbi:MAG: T9SS type A sorting domain-containing protein, partial [Candidatus Bipolaricaulota bacterium]|nr:T9SS type A sorting domain-containing protein [Candidatus Bipolaricaulota bacterium]